MKIKTVLLSLVVAASAGCTHHEPAQLTPLMSAASAGNTARVKELIAAGANVNEPRGLVVVPGGRIEGDNAPQGETALMFAIDSGDIDTVRVLLDAGARVDIRANWENNAWNRLTRRLGKPNDVEILRLLLSRSPTIPSDLSVLLLADAMHGANEAVVSIVLDQVDDPMIAYCFTTSPLNDVQFASMVALLERRVGPPKGKALECGPEPDTPAKLSYFLEHGADPDLLRHTFRPLTGLVFEIVKGGGMTENRRAMIKLLLRYGADPTLRDATENGSAIDMARKFGNTELVELLTQGTAHR